MALWVRDERNRGLRGQNGQGRQGAIKSTTTIDSEIAANAALVLLAVACSLLDRQLATQAATFEAEGGFTERLYRVRSGLRSASTRSTPSAKSTTG